MNEQSNQKPVMGIAWYRPDQWNLFLEKAADREELEDTFEEWKAIAEESIQTLEAEGILVQKIDVDINELMIWCQKKGYQNNSKARSEYATEKLRKMHK